LEARDVAMVSEQQLERCFELGLKSFVNEAQFFTCLLNAMVYVHAPVSDDSKNVRLIQFRHPDGFDAIPFFTSAHRSERAASRAVRTIHLPCAELLKATLGATLMVNPNDGGAVLYPEEVRVLLRTGTLDTFEKVESENGFAVRPAENLPSALVETLRMGVAQSPFIKTMFVLEKRPIDGSSAPMTLLLYLGVELKHMERGARAVISAIHNMNPRIDQIIDVAVYDAAGPKPEFIGAICMLSPNR